MECLGERRMFPRAEMRAGSALAAVSEQTIRRRAKRHARTEIESGKVACQPRGFQNLRRVILRSPLQKAAYVEMLELLEALRANIFIAILAAVRLSNKTNCHKKIFIRTTVRSQSKFQCPQTNPCMVGVYCGFSCSPSLIQIRRSKCQ